MCAAENATAGGGPGNFQGEEQRASGWATEEGRCGSTRHREHFETYFYTGIWFVLEYMIVFKFFKYFYFLNSFHQCPKIPKIYW